MICVVCKTKYTITNTVIVPAVVAMCHIKNVTMYWRG